MQSKDKISSRKFLGHDIVKKVLDDVSAEECSQMDPLKSELDKYINQTADDGGNNRHRVVSVSNTMGGIGENSNAEQSFSNMPSN